MASTKFILICLAPAVLLLAGRAASLVRGTAAAESDDGASSLEHLDDFAIDLLDSGDFAGDGALLETASVRDLVPFIRNAFSANGENAGGLLLPKEEAVDLLEALQDVERLQESVAKFENFATATDPDKTAAQLDLVATAHNTSLVASVLTRLVSLATVKNKVSQKASTILNVLTSIKDNATKVVSVMKRVAALMEELKKLQDRLIELSNKFIQLLGDTIKAVKEQWHGTTRSAQQSNVLAFFQSLLKWAGAAKEASQRKFQLIQALFASKGKETSNPPATAEDGIASDNLRAAKATQGATLEGAVDVASSPKHPASLDTLYRDAEEARRVERDIAQTVWHQAAKCAQEGFLPLSFVRVLLGDS